MYDYYPSGKLLRMYQSGDKQERYLTTQNERDAESGYDFRNARFSDSEIGGIFRQVDPLADKFPGWTPYKYSLNNPVMFVDPSGMNEDRHYINTDGSIQTEKTNDSYDEFYVQTPAPVNSYNLVATLEKNEAGLVQFPSSGAGFGRYGGVDAGGTSGGETVGAGDHFLRPEAAAALFGVIANLSNQGINISLGDMSSSNGSDPWQKGSGHHAGHGHNGRRSGMDVDFRYINNDGNSFQSQTATTSSQFNLSNNTQVYQAGGTFGFGKNYQGTAGTVPGVSKVKGHNDHGHLGLDYNKLNWQSVAPRHPLNPFR